MPFNSDTYYMNKHRRERDAAMALARDVRARQIAGTAYEWETTERHVQRARFHSIMLLSYTRIKAIKAGPAALVMSSITR